MGIGCQLWHSPCFMLCLWLARYWDQSSSSLSSHLQAIITCSRSKEFLKARPLRSFADYSFYIFIFLDSLPLSKCEPKLDGPSQQAGNLFTSFFCFVCGMYCIIVLRVWLGILVWDTLSVHTQLLYIVYYMAAVASDLLLVHPSWLRVKVKYRGSGLTEGPHHFLITAIRAYL